MQDRSWQRVNMCKRPMGKVWLLPRRSMNEYQSWTHATNIAGLGPTSTSTVGVEAATGASSGACPFDARQSLWLQRGYQPIAFELLDSNVPELHVHTGVDAPAGDQSANQSHAHNGGVWDSLTGWLRRRPKQVDEAPDAEHDPGAHQNARSQRHMLAVDARSYAVCILSTVVELPRHAATGSGDEDMNASTLAIGSTIVRLGMSLFLANGLHTIKLYA